MVKRSHCPEFHVLHFFRDNDDGCALTVRVRDERFHIIVDRDYLRDRSENGKKISQEYQRLLNRVKETEENVDENGFAVKDEGGPSDTSDSGVEMGDGEEPLWKLYEWIMAPMDGHLPTESSSDQSRQSSSVQDWYHCPASFYHLAIQDGKLIAEEEPCSQSLKKRMQALIPDLALPKYLRDLDIPTFNAADVHILSESTDPEPIHPALVQVDGCKYFLKVVDMNQKQPTKREIRIMKEIERKCLDKGIRMPLITGLVQFDGTNHIMGFLMSIIEEPTPLTLKLDPEVSQEQRDRWAAETRHMVDVLHEHNIIWGDAKADNFLVDKHFDVWIIDFGGMYTQGWVDPELNETEEGDEMGIRKIVNALKDPEQNTMDPSEQNAEQMDVDQTRVRGAKRKLEETEAEPQDGQDGERRSKHQRVSDTEAQDHHHGARYCFCGEPESGDMIACDNESCERKWFHFSCIGITEAPSARQWYCHPCRDHLWDEFGHGQERRS